MSDDSMSVTMGNIAIGDDECCFPCPMCDSVDVTKGGNCRRYDEHLNSDGNYVLKCAACLEEFPIGMTEEASHD